MRVKQQSEARKRLNSKANLIINKVLDAFAEPIYFLDGEHKRCGNCRYEEGERCMFFMEDVKEIKCVCWEGKHETD